MGAQEWGHCPLFPAASPQWEEPAKQLDATTAVFINCVLSPPVAAMALAEPHRRSWADELCRRRQSMKEQLDQQTFWNNPPLISKGCSAHWIIWAASPWRNCPGNPTLVAVVDLNRGFAKQGALYSPAPEISSRRVSMDRCIAGPLLHPPYTDAIRRIPQNFASYPPHCLWAPEEPAAPELSGWRQWPDPKTPPTPIWLIRSSSRLRSPMW